MLFYVVYLLGGASDILDGSIARVTNTTSRLGATLDSIADFLFISIVFFKILPVIELNRKIIICIIITLLIRLTSIIVAYYKYKSFALLHTYANKITGLLMFLSVFLLHKVDINLLGLILCLSAIISANEELLIHLISNELDRDVKGILFSRSD